jgi:FtsP/CotA-like multicopper oxidase with cupredoxin domain
VAINVIFCAPRRFLRRAIRVAAMFAFLAMPNVAVAVDFVEPPVFASSRGVLDLLIVVLPQPVPSINYVPPSGPVINPTGWVYQICPRASASGNQCPAGSPTTSYYGGIRLALQKGDLFKFRLVNQLPPIDSVTLANAQDGINLPLNPTNIHTHGMVVQARAPTLSNPTWGDNIFVDIYNPANGMPIPDPNAHGATVIGFADYQINIPPNHPSGLFWFHPHVHGIAVNQVSGGMAGIITVGQVGDYVFGDIREAPFPESNVRYLVLKDMQVLAGGTYMFANGNAAVPDGTVLNQEDVAFCTQYPASDAEVRQGSCPGTNAMGDNDYTGGTWFFTVSGQQFPAIPITAPDGEIWRITNAGANVTYDLELTNDATGMPIITQLISVDGVSIDVPPSTSPGTVIEVAGGRFRVAACPPAPPKGITSVPVCISDFVMMPSSRVELWVTYRDANGNVATPPSGATGTFKTIGITTGATGVGDPWPAIDLAQVQFNQTGPRRLALFELLLRGDALKSNLPNGIFFARVPYAKASPPPPNCSPLAPGHHRRIFFGLVDPTNPSSLFGLGYEEVDQNGAVVPGTQIPVTSFNPGVTTVCLPLDPGQKPAHESWELVNLATENHNFHIHQTKFRFVQPKAVQGSLMASPLNQKLGAGIMEDNVPLPVTVPVDPNFISTMQNGYCTIDQWHTGVCKMTPVLVDIPFSQLGSFVFHCHILDHEDGGMMAKIQVVAAPR